MLSLSPQNQPHVLGSPPWVFGLPFISSHHYSPPLSAAALGTKCCVVSLPLFPGFFPLLMGSLGLKCPAFLFIPQRSGIFAGIPELYSWGCSGFRWSPGIGTLPLTPGDSWAQGSVEPELCKEPFMCMSCIPGQGAL